MTTTTPDTSGRRSSASLTTAAPIEGGFNTVRRGLRLSPEVFDGLWLTLTLAMLATIGRVVIPVTIQQVMDRGIIEQPTPDLGFVAKAVAAAFGLIAFTTLCQILMNRRLFRASESGLASLRTRAFRHVHDLSLLTQGTERRGSLVSRVTSDVDTISQFISFGGVMLLVATAQLLIASVVMAVYSWQLTLVVWVCFVPSMLVMRQVQLRIRAAYSKVRLAVGAMLGAVSESLVGAATVRAYGVTERSQAQVDERIQDVRKAQIKVLKPQSVSFSLSEFMDGFTLTLVIICGLWLGVSQEQMTLGELLAFTFLITLFTMPMRLGIEILNEAQNALAGWGRVLGVLDTPADIADPARLSPEDVEALPPGHLDVRVDQLRFTYPEGPEVLHGISVEVPAGSHVAIVGETGSGKTTFAKLLTRLMDPDSGTIKVGGVDLRRVPFDSLRNRVVIVPQDGFLFDADIGTNLRYGRPDATDADLWSALRELRLDSWVSSLPHGLESPVGQRGEYLSAGERQLLALGRAYVADPELLVLDEATSAVDPAADVALQRVIEGITRGRTTVTIAHRLSTAENADQVLVFDAGNLVERGRHDDLVALGGIYARLHSAWISQRDQV